MIVEFILTWGAFVAAMALAAADVIVWWAAFGVCVLASSMIYMPLHEATTRTSRATTATLGWLDEVIGRMSGWIFAFGFREHRMSHMLHHAHTNELGRDPDMVVAGKATRIPGTILLSSVMSLLTPLFVIVPPTRKLIPKWVQRRLGAGGAARGDRIQRLVVRRNLIEFVLLVGFSIAGYWVEAWLLWWVPTRIAFMWVGFIFGWFPHHPHQETARYRDTRVATFPGSTLMIRGHDHHLLHHLYPRVAHYRLPALWADIGPTLLAKGARVEGQASPAGEPIIWR